MSTSIVRNCFYLSRKFYGTRLIFPQTIRKTLFSSEMVNTRTITRSFFYLSRKADSISSITVPFSNTCSCNCGMHSKGDKELIAFLGDEILNEKKSQKPYKDSMLDEFQCNFEGAEVTLTRRINNEMIKIAANVNNSVDAEDSVMDPNETKEPQEAVMESKPDFTVEITKGKKTLSFHCVYSQGDSEEEPGAEPYNDVFQISEISLYEGEYEDATYTVSGEIMDGYLYDLLMNYLEERGISNDFVDKLVAFFTHHEHKLYVSLLEGMKNFLERQ